MVSYFKSASSLSLKSTLTEVNLFSHHGKIVNIKDFKDGIKKSSAQITNYSKNELLNRKIIAVTNFPQKNIAGVLSEVLILGAITDKEVKLLGVNPNVENGTKIG